MHLILHDLSPEQARRHLPAQSETVRWFDAAPSVKPCTGCYGCWTTAPAGECVIPDRGQEFCHLLAQAGKLTIVSRCYYGGFSPDVKAVIDRHIGYMLPYFHAYEGEMHHVPRYERRIELAWHLYGDISEAERETTRRYAAANERNFHAASHTVAFYDCASATPGAEERPHAAPASPPVSRVAFINGSPRGDSGVSTKLLKLLEAKLPGIEIVHGWRAGTACDAFVFAFPLYVDGIPSNLLRELAAHENDMPPGARVYALVNNGFYEGTQNATAIAILRNWSARAGLAWGQGLGVGAGEILQQASLMAMAPFVARGSMKRFDRAMDTLAGHILAGDGGEDLYHTPDMPPRWGYMLGGDLSFRLAGKKNGLSKREMKRRL